MTATHKISMFAALAALVLAAGCARDPDGRVATRPAQEILDEELYGDRGRPRSTIWDLFRNREEPGRIGSVNRYIWVASLDVLDFLPIESVDPFTGVITTGFGTPPGGGRAYRATVLVSDPALEGRSLNLSLVTRAGPADPATVRAVEDAILTRARQLREADKRY